MRSCMCDERCIQFEDCCNNSKYYEETGHSNVSSYKCLNVRGGSSPMLIKTSCSELWQERSIAVKCNLSEALDVGSLDIDVITPVTSYNTNVTYGNVYCALCNYDDYVQYWRLSVNCTSMATNTGTPRYKYQYHLQIPTDIPLDFCQAEVVRSCPDSWAEENTTELCENGSHLLVKDLGGKLFRNKHCAYCNGRKHKNLRCAHFENMRRFSAPRSFSVLFDFRRASSNPEICDAKVNVTDVPSVAKMKAHFCPSSNESKQETDTVATSGDNWFFAWYTTVALTISSFFLTLHLVMFSVVKEMQTFAGKSLASFCSALLSAYLTFLTGNTADGVFCAITAISMYYYFLVVFVCMLTMSYDLWRTFWNVTKKLCTPHSRNTSFLVHTVLSWLAPLVPVTLAMCAQFRWLGTLMPERFSPRFGEGSCWFNNNFALLVYFVVPVFVMMLTSCVFFLHAAYMIGTNQCKSASRRSKVDFRMYARLALLTGFTWITGFVAGYLQNTFVWFGFIFLNATQGVFICVAFTFKKKLMLKFLNRVGVWKGVRDMDTTTTEGFSTTGTKMVTVGI